MHVVCMDFQNFGLKIGRGVKLVCDFSVSSGVKDLRGCFIARYFLGMSKPGLQILRCCHRKNLHLKKFLVLIIGQILILCCRNLVNFNSGF